MLRDDYATRFAAFPNVAQSAPHDGRFNRAELDRIGPTTPAIFVATLSTVDASRSGDEIIATRRLAAFVVTNRADDRRIAADADPDSLAYAALESPGEVAQWYADRIVAELINGERVASGHDAPQNIRARNLFANELADRGHTLWIVQWDQSEALDIGSLEATLSNLVTVHTDYDIPPHADPDTPVDAATTTNMES
jgi:hypothetical protein